MIERNNANSILIYAGESLRVYLIVVCVAAKHTCHPEPTLVRISPVILNQPRHPELDSGSSGIGRGSTRS